MTNNKLRESLLKTVSGCCDSDYPQGDKLVCNSCRKDFIQATDQLLTLIEKAIPKNPPNFTRVNPTLTQDECLTFGYWEAISDIKKNLGIENENKN